MLIDNDNTLRKYIPNVFASVKGETPLFDKLEPFLATAEQWLITTFTSLPTFNTISGYADDNATKIAAQRLVVCEALRNAVPSLDLVLTPNGFGIVSNTNIAPASKERVARLIDSLREQRDDLIEQLMPLLVSASEWKVSDRYDFFAATMFPNITLANLCGYTADRWTKYLEQREQAIAIEASLAEEYFSSALMDRLRSEVICGSVPASDKALVGGIRSQIVAVLMGKPISQRHMTDLVNYVRNNAELFPEWHNSETAKLFSPPTFENKKENKGFWF